MTSRNVMPGDTTQKPGPGAHSPENVSPVVSTHSVMPSGLSESFMMLVDRPYFSFVTYLHVFLFVLLNLLGKTFSNLILTVSFFKKALKEFLLLNRVLFVCFMLFEADLL